MKRNRLFLVAGVALALTAFVAVLAFGSPPGTGTQPVVPETVPVVVATRDIALGTPVSADMVATSDQPLALAVDTYRTVDEVVGSVVRRPVSQGQVLHARDFQIGGGVEVASALRPGLRAIAVPLDQVTAVGYLVQPGDFVDVLLALEDLDGLNPVVIPNPRALTPGVDGAPSGEPYMLLDQYVNNTSVKVLVQNVQVLATQAPTVEEGTSRAANEPAFVAVLAVTPQQAELVRFAQLDGHVSLVLRAPGDQAAGDVATTGVTLKTLVDEYSVLPPRPVTP